MVLAFMGGMLLGTVLGGALVVVFSKNNKNTIAASREKILNAVQHGKSEVEKVLNEIK